MPSTYEISSCRDSQSSQSLKGRGPKVFEINPLQDPRWKAFVNVHPDASVFHQVEWLKALKSCYGYVPVALSLSPPGSPLENGLLFCEVQSRLTGNRLVSIPFSDHCEPLLSDPDELEQFVGDLAERVDKKQWKYFEIRPMLYTPNAEKHMGVSQNYYFHRLDLRPSEQALLEKFHKDSVRRKIRRAEREGLRYEEGTSETLLQHFYKLMIITRRRQGLPPQPLKWFRSLIACMRKDIQIRVALKGDTPVASILTLSSRRSLVYKYGCSDSRFSNLGGMALLLWKAIQQAKANGFEAFDMGRSNIDNPGLTTFKEHWGAERSAVNYWRYPVQSAFYNPERLIKYGKQLISITPDGPLVMLGNLLYRHIG
jgi:CelD/BcsL family acetyltransferase involved in cellulose biosynthesis